MGQRLPAPPVASGAWTPVRRPLDDLAALEHYRPPSVELREGETIERLRAERREHRRRYYLLDWGGCLFETMHSLRRFEDVLADLALNTSETTGSRT